jgi:hypothetical protein
MTVLDASEQRVALGALWRDHIAVIAFVRHFG